MTTTTAVRTVHVERLSARAELLAVVRVAMAIAVVVWMFLASQFSGGFAQGAPTKSRCSMLDPFHAHLAHAVAANGF